MLESTSHYVDIDDPKVIRHLLDRFNKLAPGRSESYMDTLLSHIRHVRIAGAEIGANGHRMKWHDQSKFTGIEFVNYANHFPERRDPVGFALAWQHHYHLNDHHWQHWIFPMGFSPKGANIVNGCMPMAWEAAIEMIADWMGASKVYRGSYDIRDWLVANKPKIHLHPLTQDFLNDFLDTLGVNVTADFGDGELKE